MGPLPTHIPPSEKECIIKAVSFPSPQKKMTCPKIILCFLLLILSCPILLVIKNSHSVQLQRVSFSSLDGVLLMNHWIKPTRSSDLLSKVCFRLTWWLSCKESACQCRRHGFDPWVGKIPWRRERLSTPVFLPGKSHRQGILEGYSSLGGKRVLYDWATEQQQQQILKRLIC